jgi:hypothetical protein
MKIIIILIIISIAALYISGNLRSGGNKYSILYVSWATSLLFFNIFMAFFLYFFTHQIKKKPGELGLPGKIGPRGYEGPPEECKFECTQVNLNVIN